MWLFWYPGAELNRARFLKYSNFTHYGPNLLNFVIFCVKTYKLEHF